MDQKMSGKHLGKTFRLRQVFLFALPCLKIVGISNQILGRDSLVKLRNVDGPGNGKGTLDECRCESDDSLNGSFATFLPVDQLSIASCCRKVCIEIGSAKTPGCRLVKPSVGSWERNPTSSCYKRIIEYVNISKVG